MQQKKHSSGTDEQERLIAEARRARELREQGYREHAMKLYPHVCARCSREFSGKKLRELTVHHKDNNHQKYAMEGTAAPESEKEAPATYKPFADLDALLKNKKK